MTLTKGEADLIEWVRARRIAFWSGHYERGSVECADILAFYQNATREELAVPQQLSSRTPAVLYSYRRGLYPPDNDVFLSGTTPCEPT